MNNSENKFWLENFGSLFNSIQIIPYPNSYLSDQINCITRLVLLITLILWLFNFEYTLHFLIICLIFLIIIYYFQKRNKMQKINKNYGGICENYTNKQRITYNPYKSTSIVDDSYNQVVLNTGEALPFCNDAVDIENKNSFAIKLNQNLANSPTFPLGFKGEISEKIDANPKTKIKPVVVPPSHDLESWRDNNLITFSKINSAGVQEEMYLSGYAESTCCDYLPNETSIKQESKSNLTKEYYNSGKIISPVPVSDIQGVPIEYYNSGKIISPVPVSDIQGVPIEYYNSLEQDKKFVRENETGWLNTSCGYNPEQLDVYLPSNLAVGNCQQNQKLSTYNKNLFTQIITPDSYSLNQVNEPINSNIGISFTQQFEPVTCKRDENGINYTLHDPRISEPNFEHIPKEDVSVNYSNVYDPRFYGYGTSYRSYSEPVTGQTRFMYDDVNAVRMPNYVTRSKIDHLPYADKYDSMTEGSEFGNIHNPHIRLLAQDSWFRDSTTFRNELQERLMRKNNAIAWQKRMYPNSNRPVGSNFVRK